jgi:hypothetical protein
VESSHLKNIDQLMDFQVDFLLVKAVPFTKTIFDKSVLSELYTIDVYDCSAVEGIQSYRIAYYFRPKVIVSDKLVASSTVEIRL